MGIGKVLARHLSEAGRNTRDVALQAGVKPSTLQSMIDRDGGTSTLNLVRVARVLGLTVEQLYEEAGMLEPAVRPVSLALAQQINRLDKEGVTAMQHTLLKQEARIAASKISRSIEQDIACRKKNVPTLPASGFHDVTYEIMPVMRSNVIYLEALVPGLMDGTAAGDFLVVRVDLPACVGETGLYQWDGVHHVCTRQPDALLVKGEHPWTRSLARPHEQLGKVVGSLRF